MALRHDLTGLERALNPMTSILIERGIWKQRHRGAVQREQGHVKTEAEAGMTQYKSRGRAADNHQQEGRKDPRALPVLKKAPDPAPCPPLPPLSAVDHQDQSHAFSITYHEKLRTPGISVSELSPQLSFVFFFNKAADRGLFKVENQNCHLYC